jgi:hypothetical protein
MRQGYNWTFFGIPTAQVVSLGFVAFAVLVLIYRHRPGPIAGGERTERDAGGGTAVSPSQDASASLDGGVAPATDVSPERRPTEPGAVPTPPA